jgi:hypothetical protein
MISAIARMTIIPFLRLGEALENLNSVTHLKKEASIHEIS